MANRIATNRGSFSRRSPGRLTEWFASPDASGGTTLAANTFVQYAVLTAAEKAKRPFTVTRTVGSIWVRSDQVAAEEDPLGAVGFIVVSDKASATGPTAIPDPITQEASDEWFTYRAFASQGGPILGAPLIEHQFDSKAMRKVADGEDINIVVTNADSGAGLVFILKFRMLVKLS